MTNKFSEKKAGTSTLIYFLKNREVSCKTG